MNCRIIYKDNKIDHVQAENGERSILFDSLKDIFGAEKALELYALTEEDGYKQKIQEKVRSFVGVTEKQIDKLSEVIEDNYLNTKNNEQTRTTELGESRGDRTRWNPSRGNQTLEGAPINTKRKNVTGADPELTYWAEEYAKRNGIDYKRQSKYVEVDVDRAKRIAEAYDKMEHAPQNTTVREAYENLIQQTVEQYNILVEAGYRFYFFDENNDPYDGNPMAAMEELRNEKRMGSFATEAGFGTGNEGLDVSDNPMLADTGLEWGFGSIDGQKKRVLANDLFRAVHDAFGHGLEGAGFRARGEENAWQAHARLFTGSAVAAITSETRGQNSWLNFGKYGEQNRNAKVEDTVFAPQKTGIMPEWTWKEGFDEVIDAQETLNKLVETGLADNVYQMTSEEIEAKAKELEKQGESIDEIANKTGWYKQNNQWKYLAPELLKQLTIKNYETNKVYKLQDILQNKDTLLQMYPEMADIKVVFYDNSLQDAPKETKNWGNSLGAYNAEKRVLGVNTNIRGVGRSITEVQRTLGHEFTHLIQGVEGFPVGGHKTSVIFEANRLLGIGIKANIGETFDAIESRDKSKFTKAQNKIIEDG